MYGHVACPKWNYYFISFIHRFTISPFDNIAYNIMMEQKGKGYQGVRATEVFEYENTRSDFNYCYYWEKWKTMSDYRDVRVP